MYYCMLYLSILFISSTNGKALNKRSINFSLPDIGSTTQKQINGQLLSSMDQRLVNQEQPSKFLDMLTEKSVDPNSETVDASLNGPRTGRSKYYYPDNPNYFLSAVPDFKNTAKRLKEPLNRRNSVPTYIIQMIEEEKPCVDENRQSKYNLNQPEKSFPRMNTNDNQFTNQEKLKNNMPDFDKPQQNKSQISETQRSASDSDDQHLLSKEHISKQKLNKANHFRTSESKKEKGEQDNADSPIVHVQLASVSNQTKDKLNSSVMATTQNDSDPTLKVKEGSERSADDGAGILQPCATKADLEQHKFSETVQYNDIIEKLKKQSQILEVLREQQQVLESLHKPHTAHQMVMQSQLETILNSIKELEIQNNANNNVAENNLPVLQDKSLQNEFKLEDEMHHLKSMINNFIDQMATKHKPDSEDVQQIEEKLKHQQHQIEFLKGVLNGLFSSRGFTRDEIEFFKKGPTNEERKKILRGQIHKLENILSDLTESMKTTNEMTPFVSEHNPLGHSRKGNVRSRLEQLLRRLESTGLEETVGKRSFLQSSSVKGDADTSRDGSARNSFENLLHQIGSFHTNSTLREAGDIGAENITNEINFTVKPQDIKNTLNSLIEMLSNTHAQQNLTKSDFEFKILDTERKLDLLILEKTMYELLHKYKNLKTFTNSEANNLNEVIAVKDIKQNLTHILNLLENSNEPLQNTTKEDIKSMLLPITKNIDNFSNDGHTNKEVEEIKKMGEIVLTQLKDSKPKLGEIKNIIKSLLNRQSDETVGSVLRAKQRDSNTDRQRELKDDDVDKSLDKILKLLGESDDNKHEDNLETRMLNIEEKLNKLISEEKLNRQMRELQNLQHELQLLKPPEDTVEERIKKLEEQIKASVPLTLKDRIKKLTLEMVKLKPESKNDGSNIITELENLQHEIQKHNQPSTEAKDDSLKQLRKELEKFKKQKEIGEDISENQMKHILDLISHNQPSKINKPLPVKKTNPLIPQPGPPNKPLNIQNRPLTDKIHMAQAPNTYHNQQYCPYAQPSTATKPYLPYEALKYGNQYYYPQVEEEYEPNIYNVPNAEPFFDLSTIFKQISNIYSNYVQQPNYQGYEQPKLNYGEVQSNYEYKQDYSEPSGDYNSPSLNRYQSSYKPKVNVFPYQLYKPYTLNNDLNNLYTHGNEYNLDDKLDEQIDALKNIIMELSERLQSTQQYPEISYSGSRLKRSTGLTKSKVNKPFLTNLDNKRNDQINDFKSSISLGKKLQPRQNLMDRFKRTVDLTKANAGKHSTPLLDHINQLKEQLDSVKGWTVPRSTGYETYPQLPSVQKGKSSLKEKKLEIFDKIFRKILDLIISKLGVILQVLAEALFGVKLDNQYNDYYGSNYNGYSNSYNAYGNNLEYGYEGNLYGGYFKQFGLSGLLPLIIIKVLTKLSYFVQILQKSKFLKLFFVPALAVLGVNGLMLFLVWWLFPQECKDSYSAIGYNGYQNYQQPYSQTY